MPNEDPPILDDWRQGDLALVPIELPAIVLDNGELAWQAIDAPQGVAVLTQSCDIIRSVEHRPFVQIAGLVPATEEEISRAKKGAAPRP